jgi:hypothetical protein
MILHYSTHPGDCEAEARSSQSRDPGRTWVTERNWRKNGLELRASGPKFALSQPLPSWVPAFAGMSR